MSKPGTSEFDSFEFVITQDGSHTLLSHHYDVMYHSKYGALTESDHVFIKAGLKYKFDSFSPPYDDAETNILEMGFGTGLNSLLSALFARYHSGKFHYTGIEKYPLPSEISHKLNYADLMHLEADDRDLFHDFHNNLQCTSQYPKSTFNFQKMIADFESVDLVEDHFDVIYFDAFAPNSQGELWTPLILEKCYKSCRKNGVLVTYCAKGQLRRDLMTTGFTVERIPGPPGKREMLRAIKVME